MKKLKIQAADYERERKRLQRIENSESNSEWKKIS